MLLVVDKFLDSITMYRLVLYYLIILLLLAAVFAVVGILPFSPLSLLISTIFLVAVSWVCNKVFSIVFEAPTNLESVYITALILALIISPSQTAHGFIFLGWAALLAMASKYILAIYNKHIFNPVAIAVVLTDFGLMQSASWWVGTAWMMPFVVLGGLLVIRKIRREALFISFFVSTFIVITLLTLLKGNDLIIAFKVMFFSSSLFFFGLIMLTEPLTTPPTRKLQVLYGALVGVLFPPQLHVGTIYSTPELALVIGNIFSYIVSPKQKLVLTLKQKMQVGLDSIDFIFTSRRKLRFTPGQYMEITLPHPHPDSRGNRRYFTIASSPTEDTIRFGVKFYVKSSSFKKHMINLDDRTRLVAAQLAGDFTLPDDPTKKLVFIAGGIGITPFRSMIKYLIDKQQKRSIVLLYANTLASEIMYKDIFHQASNELGIQTVYTLTNEQALPPDWMGRVGRINERMIKEEVPDFKERLFYLSGPHSMVIAYETILHALEVPKWQIKTDFFPGYT